MIRVDLGKDDVQRGKSKLGKLLSLGKGKSGGKLGKGLGKATIGARTAVVFAVAGALALLPHLFFQQYRSFVVEQQNQRVKEIRDKLTVLNQETERLLPYKRELESYEAQKKLVRDRLDIVRQLLTNRNAPVSVLDAIGQALPKRAWLVKTDMKLDGPKAEIVLIGQAYANEDISDYIDALQKSVFISEAVLKSVNKQIVSTLEVKQFIVNVTPKVKPMMAPATVRAAAPVAVGNAGAAPAEAVPAPDARNVAGSPGGSPGAAAAAAGEGN